MTKRKENDKIDENKKENLVKSRTRLNAISLEPKPANTPPKKGAKPKKIQLNDGVVGLKRFLELKAQARYRPDTESDSAISVSTADCQKILLNGEDGTGK